MKKLLSILLLIPSLAFGASAGGGAGANITSESQHPLRHKDNRIVTEAYGANSGVTVESQLHNIIDGIGISPGTYVPYTGAISAVDLNSQSLSTTGTLSAGATTVSSLTSSGTGQSIFNEGLVVNEAGGGVATDNFRVETDGLTSAFVVDAVNNQITASAPIVSSAAMTCTTLNYTTLNPAIDLTSRVKVDQTTPDTLTGTFTIPIVNFGSSTGVSATATDGVLTLQGLGTGTPEYFTINLNESNKITFDFSDSGTNSVPFVLAANGVLRLGDDNYNGWGAGTDAKLGWETSGNDNLQLGLKCNDATTSGYFSIMEFTDCGDADRSPLAVSVNPVLRIYSSDATQALDYLEFYHNQTNPVINIGNGALSITGGNVLINSVDDDGTPATGKLVVKGTTNDGTTNIFVGRDSDEANVFVVDTNGNLTASGAITISDHVRSSPSLYRRYYHIPPQKLNPGASGATWVDPSANTIGGWNITTSAQTLILNSDIHSDWDGTSDPKVDIVFALGAAGVASDTVDIRINAYYNTAGDSATKTQAVEVATVTDGTQYKVYKATFTLDRAAAGNFIEAGDNLGVIVNIETDTSEIDNIIILHAAFYYQTTHIGVEDGDI